MRYATSAALTHACMHVFLLKKVAKRESPAQALKHGAGGLPRVPATLGLLVGRGPDSGSHLPCKEVFSRRAGGKLKMGLELRWLRMCCRHYSIALRASDVMRYATSAALTHACMHVFLLKKLAKRESPEQALKHGAGGLPLVPATLGPLVGRGPDSGSYPAGGS